MFRDKNQFFVYFEYKKSRLTEKVERPPNNEKGAFCINTFFELLKGSAH